MTQEEKFQKEEEFLNVLAQAYTNYEVGSIPEWLAPDLIYYSTWVFQEMHSSDEYIQYLTVKLQTMRSHQVVYKFFVMYEQGSGKPFLMITKKEDNQYIGFACKCNDEGKIYELGIMPASFYHLSYKDEAAFKAALGL